MSKVESIIEQLLESRNFNEKTTGMSFYDNMLRNPDYFRENKGYTFVIEYMKPSEYIRECALLFKASIKRVIDSTGPELVQEYADLMDRGTQFPMLVLDWSVRTQEGRHRALAAEQIGLREVPVMVVNRTN